MSKLLILGASLSQIPFINTAKGMGCYIGIVDRNPAAPAVPCADEYFNCSLLDVDGICRIAEIFKPNGITCGTSDVGVMAAAVACHKFNLPSMSVDTAFKVKDKGAMIEAFETYKVPHPRFQILEKETDKIDIEFPMIIKPVDNSGSRGIYLAHNEEELTAAISGSLDCSVVKRVIVEEYLDGPEVSVEILIQNGEIYILQVTDKMTSGAPHFAEIGHSQPSRLPSDDVEKIKKVAYEAVKAVGIQNGCCHAEIKLTSKGPKMVEIAGRLGGDFITTVLVPISTGVNMSEYEICRAIGRSKRFDRNDIISDRSVAVRFIESKKGYIQSVSLNLDEIDMTGLEKISIDCKYGTEYVDACDNNSRWGYIVAVGKTPDEALAKCEEIKNSIVIKMV